MSPAAATPRRAHESARDVAQLPGERAGDEPSGANAKLQAAPVLNVGDEDEVTRVMTSNAIVETHAQLDAERRRAAAPQRDPSDPRLQRSARAPEDVPVRATATAPREEERGALAVYDRPVATLAFAESALDPERSPAGEPVSSRMDRGLTPEPFSAPMSAPTRVEPLAAAARFARAPGGAELGATRSAEPAPVPPVPPVPRPPPALASREQAAPPAIEAAATPSSQPRWKRRRGPPRGLLIGLTAAAIGVSVLAFFVLRKPAPEREMTPPRAAPPAAAAAAASASPSAAPRDEVPAVELSVAALPSVAASSEPSPTKKGKRKASATMQPAAQALKPPPPTAAPPHTAESRSPSPDGLDVPPATAVAPQKPAAATPPTAAEAEPAPLPQPPRGPSALEDPGF